MGKKDELAEEIAAEEEEDPGAPAVPPPPERQERVVARPRRPVPAPVSRPVQAPGPPFTVGTWHGHRQWRCSLCPWDTLDGEQKMLEHIAARHAPPRPRIQAYDARGRPIEVS